MWKAEVVKDDLTVMCQSQIEKKLSFTTISLGVAYDFGFKIVITYSRSSVITTTS